MLLHQLASNAFSNWIEWAAGYTARVGSTARLLARDGSHRSAGIEGTRTDSCRLSVAARRHATMATRVLLVDDNPQDRLLTRRALAAEFPDLELSEVIGQEQLDAALGDPARAPSH
jgi:hypothetical protein